MAVEWTQLRCQLMTELPEFGIRIRYKTGAQLRSFHKDLLAKNEIPYLTASAIEGEALLKQLVAATANARTMSSCHVRSRTCGRRRPRRRRRSISSSSSSTASNFQGNSCCQRRRPCSSSHPQPLLSTRELSHWPIAARKLWLRGPVCLQKGSPCMRCMRLAPLG